MTLNPLILQKMNTPHHASSIEILKSIALEAGAIVRKGFAASKEITHKGTADLVTQYDVATEQFIIEKGQINQRTFGYSTRKYATR